jgi:hypothetical protein
MIEWLYHLPVVWMASVIFTATYVIAWIAHATVMTLARGSRVATFRRIAAGVLSPLGTIFGLLGGFLAVQVWTDLQRAHDAVSREAGALRAAVILAANVSGDANERIRALIARHIQEVTSSEWPAMERQDASIATAPETLVEALRVALRDVPSTGGQITIQHELARSIQDALQARRDRILISRSSINWVKWSGLAVQAVLLLVTIAMVHCDHPGTAAVAMGIFATAVATSALLIASHARPFTGEISVRPDILREIIPSTMAADPPQR